MHEGDDNIPSGPTGRGVETLNSVFEFTLASPCSIKISFERFSCWLLNNILGLSSYHIQFTQDFSLVGDKMTLTLSGHDLGFFQCKAILGHIFSYFENDIGYTGTLHEKKENNSLY